MEAMHNLGVQCDVVLDMRGLVNIHCRLCTGERLLRALGGEVREG